MCLFKPMPGEYRRVVDHVRKMRPGITNQEISKLPWRYFRRMMRFICPSPFIIMTQLRDMCEVFSKMIDPKTKKYFLVPDWRSKLQKSLRYVATGMLSDKQGLSYYQKTKTLWTGFQCYRNLRSSSPLEGYHVWIRRLVEHCYTAGIEWLDTIMNAFDFRWILRAGRVAGLYDSSVQHFDMKLRDMINSTRAATPGLDSLEDSTLHRSVRDEPARIHHGSFFAQQEEEAQSASAVANLEEADDGAAGVNVHVDVRKLHLNPTLEDTAALLESPAVANGDHASLVDLARSRGLMWAEKDVERFLLVVTQKEALLQQLAKFHYPELYSQLRAPMKASAAQQASHDASKSGEALQPKLPASEVMVSAPVMESAPEAVQMGTSAAGGPGANRHGPGRPKQAEAKIGRAKQDEKNRKERERLARKRKEEAAGGRGRSTGRGRGRGAKRAKGKGGRGQMS